MAVCPVPGKEHAHEAVENFLVIQIFHCASFLSSLATQQLLIHDRSPPRSAA